ncbi:carboxypeptidase N subunit 2-like [Ruditapes philippinarum]|uniref:carboxypeptidase N subunit 2-like n=1 Tax=Ruditapes philippinarum TaxID=129788 RepID=UPI00295AB693|nr:carboxypeptidase N subunit 2-like [Ruditapes philippinarum]
MMIPMMLVSALLVQMLFVSCHCFVLETDATDCPVNCSCADDFICSNRSLQMVPWIPKTRRCKISLNDNHLTNIEAGIFKNQSTSQVCNLNFDSNEIQTIADGAFDWIRNASITFYLRQNNLSSIPKAFENLSQLRALYLNENPLMHLSSQTMISIGRSLMTFTFDMGYFQSWPHELRYLRSLATLKIGYIPFYVLPQNAFHGFESTLVSLEIHNSRLEEIPRALCIFNSLQYLNFSSNHNLNRMTSQVTSHCTHNSFQVSFFYFDDNNMEIFPDLSLFHNVYSMTANKNGFLVMNGDFLTSLNFTIYSLDLNRNNFTRIPYAVNEFRSLAQLNMAYNSITSVAEPDVSKLTDLNVLDLKGNPILYISKESFINNLKLNVLDLSETRLSQIPVAVMTLSNLVQLGLDNTPVDCTCDLAYLKSWNKTNTISDTSHCYLSTEKTRDFLEQSLIHC